MHNTNTNVNFSVFIKTGGFKNHSKTTYRSNNNHIYSNTIYYKYILSIVVVYVSAL